MANQENFKTDVTSASKQYQKYTVSRIIEKLSDNLLQIEAPANFPVDLHSYNVHINVYSLADNSLIYDTVVSNEETPGVLVTKTYSYNDATARALLFIDFSKALGLNLPAGQVSITLNFFKNEVGSFDNQALKVTAISTTRQEVELELTDNTQLTALTQFATPYVSVPYVDNVLKQIFNQPNSSNLVTFTTGSQTTSQLIAKQFTGSIATDLVTYGFDTGSTQQPGVYQIAQQVLDKAYVVVSNIIAKDVQNFTSSFTSTYLNTVVQAAIRNEYAKVVSSQQYRFILL